MDLMTAAKGIESELIAYRRDLHQNPELSSQESETAAKVVKELQLLGLTCRTGVGGHGIIADLQGSGEQVTRGDQQRGSTDVQTIALRADMDALPIQEETGLHFSSQRPGIMHACGHDAHTAILLGAAKLLVQRKHEFVGKIRFIFQGAEEVNDGAKRMIQDGVLEGVDEIYGLHNLPTLAAGKVATRYGALMGSVDRFEFVLEGRGGHGAIPNQAIDPIVAASAIIMALQTVVSREVSPFEPAVVTVGSIHAGNANNVIPQRAECTGTIRTFSAKLQQEMPARIRRIVESIAESYRCKVELRFFEQSTVLVNHDPCVRHAEQAIDQLIGADHRLEAEPTLAGEDFAMYLKQIPGCFFWLGSGPAQGAEHAYGLHHPKFNLNEDCISLGAALLANIALRRLNKSTS